MTLPSPMPPSPCRDNPLIDISKHHGLGTKLQENAIEQNVNPLQTSDGFPPFVVVHPAGRNHLEVKVLYTLGKGKC